MSGTLRIEAGALQEDAGKDEIVAVEYVDPFAERLLHEAARRMIGQPALEMQPALERREARPLVGPLRHVEAQRLLVREGKMREVEKVVVDQQIMRAVVELARLQPVSRIVERQRGRNGSGIGFRGIAHPHPDPAAHNLHRVAPHAGALRDQLLAGDLDAASVGRELQAVIHAAQVVALEPAERQRRKAMAAAILERHDLVS